MTPPATIPDHFICPITLEIMDDPVICSDGITYNRDNIERWLETNSTSPKTNQVLKDKILIPNYALKSGIMTDSVLVRKYKLFIILHFKT